MRSAKQRQINQLISVRVLSYGSYPMIIGSYYGGAIHKVGKHAQCRSISEKSNIVLLARLQPRAQITFTYKLNLTHPHTPRTPHPA